MRTIGLLGGMSWVSTAEYYRHINSAVNRARGGTYSAALLVHSFDFGEIDALQRTGAWSELASRLSAAARGLQRQGADGIAIACNTMHRVADAVAGAIDVPLLHIADPVAAACRDRGWTAVGLLGGRFTMAPGGFYVARLAERGIATVLPEEADAREVDRIIYAELCRGEITAAARSRCAAVIGRLAGRGAAAAVLGCTELPLLIGPDAAPLPLLDSTALHCAALVRFALGDGGA